MLKLNDLTPIYLQIIKYVKMNIVLGDIEDGEELPSRRILSALLGVNPNTIQKAYKYMEDEGFVETVAGSKSCLMFDDKIIHTIKHTLLSTEASHFIESVKHMGLALEEAKLLIESYWGDI